MNVKVGRRDLATEVPDESPVSVPGPLGAGLTRPDPDTITAMGITRYVTLPGAAYVAAVGVLSAVATADPDHITVWAWVAVLVLTLPALIVTLPVLYVIVPLGWTISNHLHVAWPTTLAYVLCLSLAATLNVILVSAVRRGRRARRMDNATS